MLFALIAYVPWVLLCIGSLMLDLPKFTTDDPSCNAVYSTYLLALELIGSAATIVFVIRTLRRDGICVCVCMSKVLGIQNKQV